MSTPAAPGLRLEGPRIDPETATEAPASRPTLPRADNPFLKPGKDHPLTLRRPALEAQLEAWLNRNQSVVLLGPAGSGKSRLSREFFRAYLARKVLEPHIFCVRVELDSLKTAPEALGVLLHRFREELDRRGLLYEGMLPELSAIGRQPGSLAQGFQALASAFEIVQGEGCELVWFLDPITPEICARLAPVLDFLTEWQGRWGRLCVCARTREALPTAWQTAIARGEFQVLEQPPFSRRETWRYLVQALRGRQDRAAQWVTRAVVTQLHGASGGHPATLKPLAGKWLEAASAQARPGAGRTGAGRTGAGTRLIGLLSLCWLVGCVTVESSTGGHALTPARASTIHPNEGERSIEAEPSHRVPPPVHRDPALPATVATIPYEPALVTQVALVPIKDFTPSDGVRVQIEEPLTGTLIRSLREQRQLDVLPGFLPNARSFQSALRSYVQGARGSKFPKADFETLRTSVPAQSYLVYWIERSSRELVVNEARETVPSLSYTLQTVAVLLDPEGRIYWRTPFKGEAVGESPQLMAKAFQQAAEGAAQTLVTAFSLPTVDAQTQRSTPRLSPAPDPIKAAVVSAGEAVQAGTSVKSTGSAQTVSGAATSGEGTSADGAPTDGAPTDGAPTNGAPTNGAPTDGLPPALAPADAVPSQPSPQDLP